MYLDRLDTQTNRVTFGEIFCQVVSQGDKSGQRIHSREQEHMPELKTESAANEMTKTIII